MAEKLGVPGDERQGEVLPRSYGGHREEMRQGDRVGREGWIGKERQTYKKTDRRKVHLADKKIDIKKPFNVR